MADKPCEFSEYRPEPRAPSPYGGSVLTTRVRWVACVVIAASLVAGCTSSATPTPSAPTVVTSSPEASGEVAQAGVNAAAVEPWKAGPVAASDASGPTYPEVWPTSTIVGSGQASSLTPRLVVPDDAKVSGDVRFQIVDLSGGGGFGADGEQDPTGLVVEQDGPASGFTVPAGLLTDGATYAWRVRTSDGWAGPWAFAIDTVRSQNAPVDIVDAVKVNVLSGVPETSWTPPEIIGTLGPLTFSAVYRPGQPATPGLPTGWSWLLPGSGMILLEESTLSDSPSDGPAAFGGDSGPLSVTLRSASGAGLTFVRSETGAYVPGLADGTATSYSRGGVLTRMGPGIWQYATSSGATTRFVDGYAVSEWSGGSPVAEFTWDTDGRLAAIGDGISRTVQIGYADSGACPASAWGGEFSVADGMWCSATHPDGTVTAVGYVGKQIGLIADPGGLGTGYGWDAAGRLAAIRGTGATAAAATAGGDWTAGDLTTRLTYAADGRVATVTRASAVTGAPAITRIYRYPSGAGDTLEASVTQVTGDGEAEEALAVTATSDRWQLLTSTTFGELTTSAEYDRESGVAVEGSDPQGRTTTTKLDSEALMRSSVGPFTGTPEGALVTDRAMDATVRNPEQGTETDPWTGLSAVVWSGEASTPQWWDERAFPEGTLSGTTGTTGAWQAQASALWKVPSTGTWDVEITGSDGIQAEVVIDGVRCSSAAIEPCRMRLREGERALSLAMSGQGEGAFQVKAGQDGDPKAIPLRELRPNYNATTVVSTNDIVGGRNLATQVFDIDRPWAQKPDTVTASGGLVTAYDYEPFDPTKARWGRESATINAGGATQRTSYYGETEQATDPCSGTSAPQAGLPRTVTRYDGVSITFVYDAAGRPVAQVTEGAGLTETRCVSYDVAGRITSTQTKDGTGAAEESSTTSYTWANGVLTVAAAFSVGSESYTTTTQLNIHGGTVSYVDAWGTSTTFDYDAEGFLVARATTPPGADSPALRIEFAYDTRTGAVTRVTANGQALADVQYSDRNVPQRIDYPAGVVQSFGYATSGAPDVVELTAKDVTIVQRRDRNAGGRTLGSVIDLRTPGQPATSAAWEYSYDDAGRLVTARMRGSGDTAAFGGEKRTFDYDYGSEEQCPSQAGDDFNRTGGARDGVAFVTCYDDRGRMTWTSDPALAPKDGKARATWDGLGRLTRLEATTPLEIAWSAGTQASTVTEGDATTQFTTVGGRLIRESVAGTPRRLGYADPASSLPSVLMDDDGTVTGFLVGLPGGAIARLDPAAAVERIDYPDLFVGTLASTDARGAATLARQFGPYGEPLVPQQEQRMAYEWQSTPRNPTLTGAHELTFSARPYHPWLGAFLAFDPLAGASPTGYGYGDGNPLDQPDTSGGSSGWDIAALVLGSVAAVLGVASGSAARSSWGGDTDGINYQLALFFTTAAAVGIAAVRGVMYATGAESGADGVFLASAIVSTVAVIGAAVGLYRWDDQVTEGVTKRLQQAMKDAEDVYAQADVVVEQLSVDQVLDKKAQQIDDYDLGQAFKNFD